MESDLLKAKGTRFTKFSFLNVCRAETNELPGCLTVAFKLELGLLVSGCEPRLAPGCTGTCTWILSMISLLGVELSIQCPIKGQT